ncbi:unnamed protein product [Cuscuta epithymum]|uniref:Homeobox domain-containing protein n=1 Tax=Cuscuta epithymum TaxID=186058 RepID=A0AAV0EKJ0_9ASTE|nr:unnamed protein product [Cuscuta epithymum]
MSGDYYHHPAANFTFSNGFEKLQTEHIRRERLRVQGFEPAPPPPLVAMEEEHHQSTGLHHQQIYETTGMLSEMFNFSSPENPECYRLRPPPEWHGNRHGTAADMQLFLTNPSPPSPPPLQDYYAQRGGNFGHFTNSEIGGVNVVEGRGLSLSLSSSLHPKAAEELRMGGEHGGMIYFSQGGGQNFLQTRHNLPGGVNVGQSNPVNDGSIGSSMGVVNALRNSKYANAAQELLEEFCSVSRDQSTTVDNATKLTAASSADQNPNLDKTIPPSSGSKAATSPPPLSASDRIEHQRRKVKLLSMLDEVDRRYNHYCEQMKIIVNSFDLVMGFGASMPYTSLAQRAMSRHFRCLKGAISTQLKHSCELLGDKDSGGTSSCLTKGETPRLKMLEQTLRKQREIHQMGMLEHEAWRPQRGLPERSVNMLRSWLFEHFLHPYPSDADKHLLARQTGLSRNQVSNWFINARVRLWKPMVEEMYQQEAKANGGAGEKSTDSNSTSISSSPNSGNHVTAPTPPSPTTVTITAQVGACKRSERNCDQENDPSLLSSVTNFPEDRAGSPSGSVLRLGTTGSSGDVSLTLGLHHHGNLPPDKKAWS